MARRSVSVLTAAVLAAGLAVAGCESSEDRAERHFNSGVALLEQGEVSQALLEFRNALRLQPENLEARMHIARAQRDRGNIPEAYREFLQVVERAPDTAEARIALAQIALEAGDWEDGDRHGRAAVALAPDDPQVRLIGAVLDYRDAMMERDRGRAEEPADVVRDLLGEGGDSAVGWRVLIDQALADGTRLERGLDQIEQALESRPDIYDFHIMRLRVLVQLDRFDDVAPALEALRAQFPDEEEPRQLTLRFLMERELYDDAVAFMRGLAEGTEADDPAQLRLVELINRVRGPEAAVAETDRLLAEMPDALRLAGQRATIQFGAGARAEALADLEARLADAPEGDAANELRVLLARFQVLTGDPEAARAGIARVLEADAGNVEALKMEARWLIGEDRPDAAISALRRAQSGAPRDAEVMVLMASAHQREGDHDLAGERYAQAVEMSEEAPAVVLRYAAFLLGEDRLDSAEAVLTSALRRHPDRLDLLQAMAELQLRRGEWDRVQRLVWQLRAQEDARADRLADAVEADLLLRQGRRAETINFLEGMVREGSGQTSVVAALVQNQVMEGQLDGARDLLEERLAETPDDPALRFLRAGVHVLSGDLATAEATYRDLLEQFPAAEAPLRAYYGILQAQGRTDEARALIDGLMEAAPEAVTPRVIRAAELERAYDFDGAIAIYEELYAADTSNLVFANNLASLISTHRDDADSLERAHTIARRLRGTDVPAFQDTFGWIQYRRGALDDAVRYLEPAAEGLPEDPLVQYHLGMAYHALGRISEARTTLERALDIAGDAPLAQFDHAREVLRDLDTP